jgi:DNA-binding MarR family transcriptional regulator
MSATSVDPFFVGLALKRAQHELRLAINEELAALGTNISQLNVLREIQVHPGVSSVQLARLAFLTPQSLGQLVIQLQSRGLVERLQGDGRKLRHHLTKLGETLLQAGLDKTREVDASVVQDFTETELGWLKEAFETIERRSTDRRAVAKRLTVVDS